MLTPKEFAERWKPRKSLVKISKDAAEKLSLADDQRKFLLEAGLPDEAAPFLSFEFPKKGDLPTAANVYKLSAKFARYALIGSDGEGSPIAIDMEKSGAVVLLDHEDGFERTLLNSGVRQLAESLLAYRLTLEAAGGYDDDGELPAKALKQLHGQLKKIDPAALKAGCFWTQETQQVEVEGEYPASVLRELASPDVKVRLKASKHLESELRKGMNAQRRKLFCNKQATPPLIAALGDKDPQVVHNSVVALAQISGFFVDAAAYEPLKKLRKSKHPLTQRWVLMALVNIGGDKSLDDVLPLLKEREVAAREWALMSYSRLDTPLSPASQKRLRAAAEKALADSAEPVRYGAVRVLSQFGDDKSLAVLKAAVEKVPRNERSSLRDTIADLEKKLQSPKAK